MHCGLDRWRPAGRRYMVALTLPCAGAISLLQLGDAR